MGLIVAMLLRHRSCHNRVDPAYRVTLHIVILLIRKVVHRDERTSANTGEWLQTGGNIHGVQAVARSNRAGPTSKVIVVPGYDADPIVQRCSVCRRRLRTGWAFAVGGDPRCFRCTMRYWPLLRRSALTALVVGTVLTAINQGSLVLDGRVTASLYWQIPLTYLVPFCVATWGALTNSRI